jgi:hypothetical protein
MSGVNEMYFMPQTFHVPFLAVHDYHLLKDLTKLHSEQQQQNRPDALTVQTLS